MNIRIAYKGPDSSVEQFSVFPAFEGQTLRYRFGKLKSVEELGHEVGALSYAFLVEEQRPDGDWSIRTAHLEYPCTELSEYLRWLLGVVESITVDGDEYWESIDEPDSEPDFIDSAFISFDRKSIWGRDLSGAASGVELKLDAARGFLWHIRDTNMRFVKRAVCIDLFKTRVGQEGGEVTFDGGIHGYYVLDLERDILVPDEEADACEHGASGEGEGGGRLVVPDVFDPPLYQTVTEYLWKFRTILPDILEARNGSTV